MPHFAWKLLLLMPGSNLFCHNSVVSDTCASMEEWVAHPTEHTALDDIIPCVEPATANETLYRSRQVTSKLVNLVNQAITNVTNRNFPPNAQIFYYNQSGPLMPLLCNPFTPDLNNRTCTSGEVTLDNAAEVESLVMLFLFSHVLYSVGLKIDNRLVSLCTNCRFTGALSARRKLSKELRFAPRWVVLPRGSTVRWKVA
jgi:hypothetical protein